MTKRILQLALPALMFFICGTAAAQSKARISIRKEQNGQVVEETREMELQDGEGVESILRELGVLDEFGQLKPGQQFQISIEKSGAPGEEQQMFFFLNPEGTMPPMPPMAPVPPAPPMPPMGMEAGQQTWLGVMIKQTTGMNDPQGEQPENGVYVTAVVGDSPAEKAGLQAGDIITAIDKEAIDDMDELVTVVQSHKPGTTVRITYLRDGKKKTAKAVLGEKAAEPSFYFFPEGPETPPAPPMLREFDFQFRPDSITIICPDEFKMQCDSLRICQPFSWSGEGFELRETAFLGVTPGEENGEKGVIVGSTIEGSAAATMGIEPGDVVLRFNGIEVDDFDQLAAEIGKAAPGSEAEIVVLRDGRERTLRGTLGVRSVSDRDDFRIFHDYKGMDEDGNYFYDFEFDMDEQDIEQQMEELMQMLEQEQLRLDQEHQRIEQELQRLRTDRETIHVTIDILDISADEAAAVNAGADPKLETDNDLALDRLSFFPNPNDGVVNLSFVSRSKEDVRVVVYDMRGNKIYFEQLSGFTGEYANTIDISVQPDGTYYLQILQGGKSYSKKLVKGR